MTQQDRPVLNESAARGLDSITRLVLSAGFGAVKLTYESESWRALGFGSFDEWVMDQPKYQLTRAERKGVVADLREVGMTQRQIAATVGVDHRTIGRDLGANAPEPEPAPDQDDADLGANAPEPVVPDGTEPEPDRDQDEPDLVPDGTEPDQPTLDDIYEATASPEAKAEKDIVRFLADLDDAAATLLLVESSLAGARRDKALDLIERMRARLVKNKRLEVVE